MRTQVVSKGKKEWEKRTVPKYKLLCMLLAVALVCGLLPTMALPALADDTYTFTFTATEEADATFYGFYGTDYDDPNDILGQTANLGEDDYDGDPNYCYFWVILDSCSDEYVFSGWRINGVLYPPTETYTSLTFDWLKDAGEDYELGEETSYIKPSKYKHPRTQKDYAGKPELGIEGWSSANITVEAVFELKQASGYTATIVQNSNGEATINHTTGNDYELTATPNTNYAFDHWEYRTSANGTTWDDDAWETYTALTTASGSVTVTANTQFKAVFIDAEFFLCDDYRLYGTTAVNQQKRILPVWSDGILVYDQYKYWYNTDESPMPAVPGDPCGFEFQWDVTGPINSKDQNNDLRLQGRIRLYGGTGTSGTPVFDTGNVSFMDEGSGSGILQPHGATIFLNFIMPKAEYLTVVFEINGFETMQKSFSTGLNFGLQDKLDALGAELNTLENLRYRYFIDKILLEASQSATDGMTQEQMDAVVASARAKITPYLNGSKDADIIEVCFNDTLVFTETGISQSDAFMAALEQVYPRELGFWYLDCAGTQFGLWLNGYGGRAFTANELGPDGIAHTADDGVLETAIVAPSKTFAAGEPLPKSGLVMGSQKGAAQYYVNGLYSDFGMTDWKVSDNEIYTWGPIDAEALYHPLYSIDHISGVGADYMYGDDSDETALLWAVAYLHRIGVTEEQVLTAIGKTEAETAAMTAKELYEALLTAYPQHAERLSRETATDMDKIEAVTAALNAINAMDGKTGDALTAAATAARTAFDSINLNGQYGLKRGFLQGYFQRTEPYKTAYQKLVAAESELNIQPPEQATPAAALTGVLAWLQSNVKAPAVGSTNGEWAVLALARGGALPSDTKDAYLANLNTALAAGNVLTKWTDYERVTLALSALGIDAAAYGETPADLTAPYAAYTAMDSRDAANKSLNIDVFALLALNAKPYDGEQDKYITALCDAALASGGWNLDPAATVADVDMTAMAIEALAPYYATNSTVKAKVDAALAWLKLKQDPYSGGFKAYMGTEVSTSSTAQVVTALCALGIDPDGAAWTVDEMTPLTALTLWYNEEGWFGETDTAKNQMPTEQAAYALVAWDRFTQNKTALYDMSDAFPKPVSTDAGVSSLAVKGVTATASESNSFAVELPMGTDLTALTAADFTITPAAGAAAGTPATADNGANWSFTVTAEDGITTLAYTVAVTVAETLSSDVGVSSLTVKGVTAAAGENNSFTVELPAGTDLATLTAADFAVTPATGAAAGTPTTADSGANWSFTVTAEDGTTTQTYTVAVTVTAASGGGNETLTANQEAVAAVKALIPATLTASYTEVTNATNARSFVLKALGSLELDSTVTRSVTITGVTPATAGTAENPAGTAGSFTAKVTLSKGENEAKAEDEVTISGVITAKTWSDPESGSSNITVTLRLIGAKEAAQKVDLSQSDYMPDYVTWIPTRTYTIAKTATMYDLFTMAMRDAGLSSNGAENGYVTTIYAPAVLGGYALSEFTNGTYSGWMYTVNGKHPGVGLTDYVFAEDENVEATGTTTVVWHYINDYRYEQGDFYGGSAGDPALWDTWLNAPDVAPSAPSGGGSGGSSGGSSGTGSTENTEPAVEESTVAVTAETTDDGEAKAEIEADAIAEALEGSEEEVLTLKVETEDAESVELTLSAEAVKAAAEGEVSLHIETEQGTVKLDAGTLSELAESGAEVAVTVTAEEDGSFTLDVTAGGESIDAKVKVELPAAEESQVLVIVNADGSEEVIKKSVVEDGKVYAELPAGATVKVVENDKDFEDVDEEAWYAEAVEFASSHELFQGVSATEFAPEDNMTRAMLVTVLFRLEDQPENAGETSFGDVTDGAWYADAVAWASETGLVNGTDKGFEPNENVSREQIAAILYRYAGYIGLDTTVKGDVSKFGDAGEISPWAKDAMAWAVEVGLFQGDGSKLDPKGDATRGQVAALMQRLIGLIVK